jgi:transcriptional regulator with XRE-family HTH domain
VEGPSRMPILLCIVRRPRRDWGRRMRLGRRAGLKGKAVMNIGKRLRELREAKGLSQGDIEKRTGLVRCFVSRIECGYTVPSLVTLEKWTKALDLELYQLFYDGKGKPVAPKVTESTAPRTRERKLVDLFGRMPERDKILFLALAREAVKQRGEHE